MTITLTSRRVAVVSLAVVALTCVYLVGTTRSVGSVAAASTQPSTIPPSGATGITVGGTASVAGTPDTLRLDLSVVATAASVSEALAKANGTTDTVQRSLLGSGVAKKDLQTSGLNISPEYDYPNNGVARLKGYQVSESIIAKLRDVGRAGEAIGKAVTAGGNAVRVNGISLDLEETGALVSQARDKAFADAKAKAEQYARAAGRTLGEVVSIAESVRPPSTTPMLNGATTADSREMAKVPIQAGSRDVSVSVTVVFAMG